MGFAIWNFYLLFGLSLILIFTLILAAAFAKFKWPLLTAYILSGFILSIAFRLSDQSNKMFLAVSDAGVVFLMFALGLEFPIKKILNFKSNYFKLTILQVFLTTIVLFFLLSAFKFSLTLSFAMALFFSFSSTVLVVKILSSRGILHTAYGEVSTSILVMQDLFFLPLSIFLPLIFEFKEFNLTLMLNIFFIILKSGGILLLVFIFAKKIIPWVLLRVARFLENDLLMLSIIALSLFFAGVAERFGFSLAAGAFVAGMVISATTARHAVFSEIRPLRDIFSIIFFVFLGFSLDTAFVWRHLLQIVGLGILVVAVKTAILYCLLILQKIHPKNAVRISFSLSQVSEFAFIIFSIYFSRGLIKNQDYQLIISIVLFTVAISPLVINLSDYLVKKIHFLRGREKLQFALGADHSFARHVVLCGFGRIGKEILRQLVLNNVPFIAIDNNRRDIDGLREKGYNAIYGDATEIEILKFAGAPLAKVIVVAIPDRFSQEIIISHAHRLNPQVVVYCRVHDAEDKKYLYAAGARFVLYPELEGAMAMSKRILKLFGTPDLKIEESLKIGRLT